MFFHVNFLCQYHLLIDNFHDLRSMSFWWKIWVILVHHSYIAFFPNLYIISQWGISSLYSVAIINTYILSVLVCYFEHFPSTMCTKLFIRWMCQIRWENSLPRWVFLSWEVDLNMTRCKILQSCFDTIDFWRKKHFFLILFKLKSWTWKWLIWFGYD